MLNRGNAFIKKSHMEEDKLFTNKYNYMISRLNKKSIFVNQGFVNQLIAS